MINKASSSSNLETQALAQFDALVEKGELYWEPTEEIKIEQEPFDLYFRISPILLSKPYNPNNTSRKPGFQDDDPDFTIAKIEPNHKLILNKYCWLRPQLILHTLDFQSQRDLLSSADFEASWNVLREMGEQYMVIFNGGPDAGSSVAHKHLQVFPRPEWKTIADEIAEDAGRGKDVPFIYRLIPLSADMAASGLYEHYQSMCEELKIVGGVAHSLLITTSWLMLVPRACANIKGLIPDAFMQGGANAMIGMEWMKTAQQYENWKTYGPMKVLADFGVSKDPKPQSD